MKLYHATSSRNRNSIRKNGLLLEPTDGEAIRSITGGFFFCSKIPEPAEQIDVWEVNTEGLHLQVDDTDVPFDPEDTWWVIYGTVSIEPWRLSLVAPEESK